MRLGALRILYADADIARYVCVDNSECDIEEFATQLEVKAVALNTVGSPAIQIEPKLKGRQYFSALFLQEKCRYEMILAPDTTLSDVRLLKKKKNNFYMVRAVEIDSTEAWKEYYFSYDLAIKQYGAPAIRCFKTSGTNNVSVKCE